MAPSDVSALAARLEVPPERLAAFTVCTEQQLARLEKSVADAIDAEDAAVEEGLQSTLRAVPRPLRGRAKGLLFGDEGR